MNPRRNMFAGDPSTVLGRHRGLLEASPLQRAISIAGPLGLLAFTAFAVWWLAIPFSQIGPGLILLVKFIGLMFPPSTGGHLDLIMRAMGETLAIAFLGTMIAAVVAVPISFLAARNTSP